MPHPVFSCRSRRKLFYGILLFITGSLAVAEPVASLSIISVDRNATEILQALESGAQIIATDITSEPYTQ